MSVWTCPACCGDDDECPCRQVQPCLSSPTGGHYDAYFAQVDPEVEGQRRVMRCVHCNRKAVPVE